MMTPILRNLTASAAILSASALFVMTAPAARADDYCITNGAQAAHGCGYPTMEACQAASAGIGGTCSLSASSKSSDDTSKNARASLRNSNASMAYSPKQPRSRKEVRSHKEPARQ
jgi:uncharacterized protein DUF3551